MYRARQLHPPRDVALKILPPHQIASRETRTRFRAEAETIAALDHPAILPLYAVGEHQEMPYFTMKLASGGTLGSRRETLHGDWHATARLLITIAEAVHCAHTHGVIHRDLKPGNVLFDDAGRPYVSDFGIAKFTGTTAALAPTTAMLGTPAYVAPEVAQHGAGAATIASDVYGLGAILYELLAGRPPFVAPALPMLVRQVIEEPPLPPRRIAPAVPRDLETICLRCLEKSPARRFPTAAALADDLRRWQDGRPIESRPTSRCERLVKWSRRNPSTALVSLALGMTLLMAGLAVLGQNLRLREALGRARLAERAAQDQWHATLVNEARLLRQSPRVGGRAAAQAALAKAAELTTTPELRTEWIAAQSRPDLVTESVLTVNLPARNSTIAFSSDLKRYLLPHPHGGFAERAVGSDAVVRHYQHNRTEPALYLEFTCGDRTIVATYPDRGIEVWDVAGESPWWTMAGDAAPWINHGGYTRREPALAVHPLGGGLAYAAADGSVRRVERATGAVREVLPPAENLFELSFAPAGDALLVVRASRCAAYAWPDVTLLWERADAFSPCRPAWEPSGRRVALGLDGRNDVLLCAAETGRPVEFFSGHTMHPRLLAFDHTGSRLYSVAWDGLLLAWDARTGAVVLTTPAYPSVLRVAGDGRKLAFGSPAGKVVIARAEPGKFFEELAGGQESNRLTCELAVSPDGRWLATIDQLRVALWSVSAGRLVWEQTLPTVRWAGVAFSPDGAMIWQGGVGRPIFRRALRADPATDLSVLGPPEAAVAGGTGLLRFIDPASGDWWVEQDDPPHLYRWPHGDPGQRLAVCAIQRWAGTRFSPDGRFVAIPDANERLIAIREARTGTPVAELTLRDRAAIGFSPDGRWLLSATRSEYQLWEVGTWRAGAVWPAAIENHARGNFRYSPDGTLLAVRHGRTGLELRETRNYSPLLRLEAPAPLRNEHFAWSPDGSSIFVLCTGHRVARWDWAGIREELRRQGMGW